jgi:hypothetical protein
MQSKVMTVAIFVLGVMAVIYATQKIEFLKSKIYTA